MVAGKTVQAGEAVGGLFEESEEHEGHERYGMEKRKRGGVVVQMLGLERRVWWCFSMYG